MTITSKTSLALLALAGMSACSGSVTSPGAPQGITVGVEPASTQVGLGGSVTFAATVTGTADTSVNWSVQEGTAGGTVTGQGVYTAPRTAGTYHVVATARADQSKSAAATVQVTAVSVAVNPATATVAAGGTVNFSAVVTGAANTSVTWSVAEASGCGSVTQGGVYTAPAAAATCHVVATSVADPSTSATATVTVTAPPNPITVSVAPPTASVNSCQSLTFSAVVTGTSNGAVTWSVQEGAAGGSITAGGVYTAPDAAGTYHVVATSQADPTKSATAVVTVTDRILSVTVSPAQTTVTAGGSAQFTATVTTTCGAFASTQAIQVGAPGTAN